MRAKNLLVLMIAVLCLGYVGARLIAPGLLDQQMNQVTQVPPLAIEPATAALHAQLLVGDWHADTTLWSRDLTDSNQYGHVDLPKLRAGNVALQMFTTVTKSPDGLNYIENHADSPDNITRLAIVQGWPLATWTNLTERALHQASKIQALADAQPEQFELITNTQQLNQFIQRRKVVPSLVGGLLGTEGSHALEGDLHNIQRLFDAGFRMMGLQHFFDNQLGGSLHGTSNAGLTEFGRQAVVRMQKLEIIVDLAHSSEQTVADVLAISQAPVVVSHTGFHGHCPNQRNISDALMLDIAQAGGLVAVGFWDEAVCGNSAKHIASAIIYGLNLLGEDHIALGSDFDGAVSTPFDSSAMIQITQALKNQQVDDAVIAKIMGGNMLRFLASQLPAK